jgi:hypothetical protein
MTAPATFSPHSPFSMANMETQTDYKLERWLAVILSLLFVLPFVVR